MILKQNNPYFEGFGSNSPNAYGNPLPTIEWFPMLREKTKGEGFVDYINSIMGTIYFIIKGGSSPRIIT